MKDKSSYRHYRLVTVKIKVGLINSFRPVYVVSIACPWFLYFPCLSEKQKTSFLFLLQHDKDTGACTRFHDFFLV